MSEQTDPKQPGMQEMVQMLAKAFEQRAEVWEAHGKWGEKVAFEIRTVSKAYRDAMGDDHA